MPTPDYAGLKAEIASMTDDQIATALEAPLVVAIDVPVGTVEGYLRSRMLMGRIQAFVASPPQGTPAGLAEGLGELLGMLTSPHVQNVMMTDPIVSTDVQQILAGAVAVSLITAAHQTDLLAMGSVTITRAVQLGLTTDVHVVENEMLAARKWDGA
jgi:hypothetical protein